MHHIQLKQMKHSLPLLTVARFQQQALSDLVSLDIDGDSDSNIGINAALRPRAVFSPTATRLVGV